MAAESLLEKKLVRYARIRGVWTRKFSSPGNVSVPDRIFMSHGNVLFMEIKAVGQKPTDGQADEMEAIATAGGLATWANTFEVGARFIDALQLYSHACLRGLCKVRNFETQ